ncbi:MAG TPA: transcription elongation factor GreA [Actinomycetes bacterium]|nr:transcription elongation factor GreA [Actinomycetes bacterium]
MTTWLTQEAYERLTAEFEQLSTDGRTEVVNKIAAAREEGDLKENGGYHAAREEQGKLEARIKQLRHLLENAQVGQPPAADGTVQVGHAVGVTFVGGALDGENETFLLGSREQAGDHDIDVYSPQSPLGGAVLGEKIGTEVGYTLPNGKQLTVRVNTSEPFNAR